MPQAWPVIWQKACEWALIASADGAPGGFCASQLIAPKARPGRCCRDKRAGAAIMGVLNIALSCTLDRATSRPYQSRLRLYNRSFVPQARSLDARRGRSDASSSYELAATMSAWMGCRRTTPVLAWQQTGRCRCWRTQALLVGAELRR